MKVYVAARFHEKERVKKIYQELKKRGYTITVDWTQCSTQQPYNAHMQDAQACAQHTIQGVQDAEIFIFLTNPEIGAGSSAELGAALLSHQLRGFPSLYVVGPYRDNNLCLYHPAIQYVETIDHVFELMQNQKSIIPKTTHCPKDNDLL